MFPKNGDAPCLSDLDWSEVAKGVIRSKGHLLENYTSPSGAYKITKFDEVDPDVLQFQRKFRKAASGSAVGLNAVASAGLLATGGMMLANTLQGQDTENTYGFMGKAFGVAGIAGVLTGVAQEDQFWPAGHAGMGVFSNFLNTKWGFPLFIISDGLASIGMGRVRFRQESNALAIQKSIFRNPALQPLRFLQPVEQAIIGFFNLLRSPKKVLKEEPYSLFNAAGGGLVAAGGLIGVTNLVTHLFKDTIPEKIKSLPYMLYGLMTSLNLTALFRDGQALNWRTKNFKGNRKGQEYSQRAEGILKQLAVPFLGINSLLLFGKGLGLETASNALFNAANGFRAIGTAVATLAFGSQSLLNFFKPMRFGPKRKEDIHIEVNPTKAKEVLFGLLKDLDKRKPQGRYSPLDKQTLRKLDNTIKNDKHGSLFLRLSELKRFRELEGFSQAGLPAPSNIYSHDRAFLDRWTHSMQVLSVGITLFDTVFEEAQKNNNTELVNYLKEHELAFKAVCQLHDIGHTARSHVAEKALIGQDNDEYTKMILMGHPDVDPEIHQFLVKNCGKKVLNQMLEIIGRESPLYKLLKDADRYQYQMLGDFITIKNPRLQMPKGSVEGAREFAKKIRFFRRDDKFNIGYTEDGAIEKVVREYNRLIFDVHCNNTPISYVEAEILYSIGLSSYLANHPDITSADIKKKPEHVVDAMAAEGIDNLDEGIIPVVVEMIVGSQGYSGYDESDPKSAIYVVDGNQAQEIYDRIQTKIKQTNAELYNYITPIMEILRESREVRAHIKYSKKFQFDTSESNLNPDQRAIYGAINRYRERVRAAASSYSTSERAAA